MPNIGAPDWAPWAGVARSHRTGGATVFEQTITLPASTLVGAPVTQTIALAKGFIVQGEVLFPTGCAGLAKVALFNGAAQVFPGTAGSWFTGNGDPIQWMADYASPLVGASYLMTIKGYNDDDTYQHVPIVRLWVVFYP